MAAQAARRKPSYPMAHPNPWTGLEGTVYANVVEPGRGIRRGSTEQFAAWAYRVFDGRDLDPGEVTQETAFSFAQWAVDNSDPPDIRHDLINARSPAWASMWAVLVKLTDELGRAPTMFEVYRSLPRDYIRAVVPAGQHEHVVIRKHIREFVRRFHAWVEQDPKGTVAYERYKDAKSKTGFRPATVPWDQIRLILKPRTNLTVRSVVGIVRALRAVWNELGLQDQNPWIEVTRHGFALARQTPKKIEREATAAHIQRLLRTPDTRTLEGARDFAVVAATVFWGLRASELVAIKRNDVLKMDDGVVRVRIPSSRGGTERYVLLTVRMQRAIERFSILVQERESRAKGPMSKWAGKVLEPDAPLFPALFRWSSESHVDPKRALLVNAVYKILQVQQPDAPRPTEIRAYVSEMMKGLRVARPEVAYFLGSKVKYNGRDALLEGVDQAVVVFEAWLTQEAKLIW